MLRRGKLWATRVAWLAAAGLLSTGGQAFAEEQAPEAQAPIEAQASVEAQAPVEAQASAEAQVSGDGSEVAGEGAREAESEGGWLAPPSQPVCAAASPTVRVDTHALLQSQQLVFMLGTPWPSKFYETFPLSMGARFHLPLVHNTFRSSVGNWVGLELGLDFDAWFRPYRSTFRHTSLRSTMWKLTVPLEVFGGFRMSPSCTAYIKMGFGLQFVRGKLSWKDGSDYYDTGLLVDGRVHLQMGFMWTLSEKLSLRAETGTPYLLRLGLGFNL